MATRINVILSDKDMEAIRATMDNQEMNLSEFVRLAIRTYRTLLEERKEGNRLYVGKNRKVERELLFTP